MESTKNSTTMVPIEELPPHPSFPEPTSTPGRKRKYRASMKDESLEQSISDLYNLERFELNSPGTKKHISLMIFTMNKLADLEPENEGYIPTQSQVLRMEEILELRLEKDDKYASVRESFQAMVATNIQMRFGDYFTHNLKMLNENAKELDKKVDGNVLGLGGRTWQEIWGSIMEEENLLEVWKAKPTGRPPFQATKCAISDIAQLCNISQQDAIYQIRSYARRCSEAHPSSIDHIIGQGKYHTAAAYLIRDRNAIKKGVLKVDYAEKEMMLRALKRFEDKYFDTIVTWKDEFGRDYVEGYKLSKSEEARRARIEWNKEKEAVKQANMITMRECEGSFKMAEEVGEYLNEEVEELRIGLINARNRYKQMVEAKKEILANFEMAQEDFRERARRYIAKVLESMSRSS